MAQMLQRPVFALPGCQRMSVNTLLCDTLGLADFCFCLLLGQEQTTASYWVPYYHRSNLLFVEISYEFSQDFLSLLFWETQGKPPKKARIFSLCRTPKIPGKEGRNAQKSKEIPCNEKSKEIPCNEKSKERKNRVFPRKTRCFRDPAVVFYHRRSVCYHCSDYYDCSIFSRAGFWGYGLKSPLRLIFERAGILLQEDIH